MQFGGFWLGHLANLLLAKGVGEEIILILMMFPLVAVAVAFSRNVVGLNGFGIFVPTMATIALLQTGTVAGVLLFAVIFVVANLTRFAIRRIRMPYMPRLSFIIWAICLVLLLALAVFPKGLIENFVSKGIFPALVFMLLTETYVDTQINRSKEAAVAMTAETLLLALVTSWILGWGMIRAVFVLAPELSMLGVLGLNYLVARYKGLRLLEVYRFRELVRN